MKELNESNLMFNHSEIRQQKTSDRKSYQDDDDLLRLDYTSQSSNQSKPEPKVDGIFQSGLGPTTNLPGTSKILYRLSEQNEYKVLVKSKLEVEPAKSESFPVSGKTSLLGLMRNTHSGKMNLQSSTNLPYDLQADKFKTPDYGLGELHNSVSSAPKPSLFERLRLVSLNNSKQKPLAPSKIEPKEMPGFDEDDMDDVLDFPQSISESFKSYADKKPAVKEDNLEIVTDVRNQFSEEEEFLSSSETEIQVEHIAEAPPIVKYASPNISPELKTANFEDSQLLDLADPPQISSPFEYIALPNEKIAVSNIFIKNQDQKISNFEGDDNIKIVVLKNNVPARRITVSVADRMQQFKKVVFYKISGSYESPDDITNQFILRRYNDFKMFHILLGEQFYYKVLPRLPEKNILYKLKTTRQMLEQRASHLECYLNNLLEIDSVNTSDLLKQFLTDRDGFEWLIQSPETALILQKESMLQKTTHRISSVWNMISQKDRLDDPGFYAVYAKEVDSSHLFLKNTLDSLLLLQDSMKGLSHNVKSLKEVSQALKLKSPKIDFTSREEQPDSEGKQESITMIQKNKVLTATQPKNHQKLNSPPRLLENLITRLNEMLEEILSCKESMGRKDKIYQEYEQAKNQYKNSQMARDAGEKSTLIAIHRKRIDLLEQLFKPELAKKIMAVKEKLDDLIQHSLQSALIDVLKLE